MKVEVGKNYRLKPKVAKKLRELRDKGDYDLRYNNFSYSSSMVEYLVDEDGNPIPRPVLEAGKKVNNNQQEIAFRGMGYWNYHLDQIEEYKGKVENEYKRGDVVEYHNNLWVVSHTKNNVLSLLRLDKDYYKINVFYRDVKKALKGDDGQYITRKESERLKTI